MIIISGEIINLHLHHTLICLLTFILEFINFNMKMTGVSYRIKGFESESNVMFLNIHLTNQEVYLINYLIQHTNLS